MHDKEKVLSGRPWFFDRNLLTLLEVDETVSINALQLIFEPFWVQLHKLPLAAMTEEVGEQFGSSLGHVMRVDAGSDGSAWWQLVSIKLSCKESCWCSRSSSIGYLLNMGDCKTSVFSVASCFVRGRAAQGQDLNNKRMI